MKTAKIFISITAILFFAMMAIAENGETGAQFLKYGVSAKHSALGNASIANINDPAALTLNPAGLTAFATKGFMISHQVLFEDMQQSYIAGILPTKYGNAAIGLIYASAGDIPGYENYLLTSDYQATDMALQAGFAKTFSEVISVGINAQFIQQKIEEESASGFAVTAGAQYAISKDTRLGLALRNWGSGLKFIEESDPLPSAIEVGASHQLNISGMNLLIPLAVEKLNKEDISFKFGGELQPHKNLALRAGYRTNYSFAAGAGILLPRLQINYAFIAHPDLSDNHQFGIMFTF